MAHEFTEVGVSNKRVQRVGKTMFGDPRTYRIIGSAMAVHRRLGNGFLEPVYQDALATQFEVDGIPFGREVPFPINYGGRTLRSTYRADFVCFGEILVELKANFGQPLVETAQVVNYLRASGLEVGLLLNFGVASLQYKRYILTKPTESAPSQSQRAGPQVPRDGSA